MKQKIFVYISGYPGSGKTWLAASLHKYLQGTLGNQVCIYNEKPSMWQSHPFALGWNCLRHCWLLMCVTALIQSNKSRINVRDLPQTLKDVVRVVSCYSAYRTLQHSPPTQIVLIDEPPWHKLWIKIFPYLKESKIAIPKYVIHLLMPKKSTNSRSVFIQLTVPLNLSLERIKKRENPGSRFNQKSDDNFLKKLQEDPIYPLIFEQIKRNAAAESVLIDNAQVYTCSQIARIILETCESTTDF